MQRTYQNVFLPQLIKSLNSNKSIGPGGIILQYILDFDIYNWQLPTDTQSEKTPSNKTPALTESMDMSIWVASSLNQLYIRGS